MRSSYSSTNLDLNNSMLSIYKTPSSSRSYRRRSVDSDDDFVDSFLARTVASRHRGVPRRERQYCQLYENMQQANSAAEQQQNQDGGCFTWIHCAMSVCFMLICSVAMAQIMTNGFQTTSDDPNQANMCAAQSSAAGHATAQSSLYFY